MNRPYTAQTVYRAADRLRQIKENPFLACDIITGFPSETDGDFDKTMRMCTDIGFSWIHAFPFSPRPGTEAFSMKNPVPERIAGERVAQLSVLAEKNRTEYRKYWTGRTLPAIVETETGENGTTVLTTNYLSLTIPERGLKRGSRVQIRVTGPDSGILEK